MSAVSMCERCGGRHREEMPCPECAARILVVEDDASVLRVLVRTLELAGHDVVAVSEGHEAILRYRQSGPFDLLITDVVMPGGVQGADVIQALRRLRDDLPVIVVTGHFGDATVTEPDKSTRTVRLNKPVPGKTLRA